MFSNIMLNSIIKCIVVSQESYISSREFNATKNIPNKNCQDEKWPKPNVIGAVTMVAVFGLTQNSVAYRETLGTITVSEEYALSNQDALFYVSLVIALVGIFSICMMLTITRLVQGKVDERKFILFAGLLPLFIVTLFNQPMSGTNMNTHNCSKNSQGNYVLNISNTTYDDSVVSSNIMPVKNISNFEIRGSKRPAEHLNRHNFYISDQTLQNKDAKTFLERAAMLASKSANLVNEKKSISTMIALNNNYLDFVDERNTGQYSQEKVNVPSKEFRSFTGQNASSDSCRGCPVVEQPWCAYTPYIPVVQMVLVYSLAVNPEVIALTMSQAIYAKILGELN